MKLYAPFRAFDQIPRDKEYLMRRIALLVLCLGATGCDRYASNPFDGFPGFIADTHTYQRGPNSPVGNSENMQRVRGMQPETEPLVPEPGNVWPGPAAALPTLQDLINDSPNSQLAPGSEMTLPPAVRGSTTPPPMATPYAQPSPNFGPTATPPAQSAPRSNTVLTPSGPAVTSGGSGVQTYTAPGGGTGLMVPNGNGTSTLIGPDGTVQTVPTPK